ncbi:MAG: hypothetical protein MUF76_01985 [Hydrogenophaga sp.]|jgi:hypothetical protein|nr:hypothetical protein [Hydrogenophaga sp.]
MADASTKPSHKKPKLVRDSFTIPKTEFAAIDTLKSRAMAMGTSVKKSELLRAGLMLLTSLSDNAFKTAVAAVPQLKTGRPAAEEKTQPAKARTTTAKPASQRQAKPTESAKKPTKAADSKAVPVQAAGKVGTQVEGKPARKPAPKAAAKPAPKAAPARKAPAKAASAPAAKPAG